MTSMCNFIQSISITKTSHIYDGDSGVIADDDGHVGFVDIVGFEDHVGFVDIIAQLGDENLRKSQETGTAQLD